MVPIQVKGPVPQGVLVVGPADHRALGGECSRAPQIPDGQKKLRARPRRRRQLDQNFVIFDIQNHEKKEVESDEAKKGTIAEKLPLFRCQFPMQQNGRSERRQKNANDAYEERLENSAEDLSTKPSNHLVFVHCKVEFYLQDSSHADESNAPQLSLYVLVNLLA